VKTWRGLLQIVGDIDQPSTWSFPKHEMMWREESKRMTLRWFIDRRAQPIYVSYSGPQHHCVQRLLHSGAIDQVIRQQ